MSEKHDTKSDHDACAVKQELRQLNNTYLENTQSIPKSSTLGKQFKPNPNLTFTTGYM